MGKLLTVDFAKRNRQPKRRRKRGLALVMSATYQGVRIAASGSGVFTPSQIQDLIDDLEGLRDDVKARRRRV